MPAGNYALNGSRFFELLTAEFFNGSRLENRWNGEHLEFGTLPIAKGGSSGK
jgi:hypothetical protein